MWLDLPPRMTARRLASGRVLYYYQAAGKKVPLGSNIETARREWARLEAGGPALLFPAVAKLYREAVFPGLALSTRAHYEIALRNLEDALRAFTLEQVQPKHVKAYMRARSKKAAAYFEKRVLSALFNWARGEGITAAPNPCSGVSFTKAERKVYKTGRRTRYVTDAEFDAVYASGDEILQDAMDLCLLAGQRPSDVLGLTKHNIVDGLLEIQQGKTGKKMRVRIEGDLKVAIDRMLARPRKVQSIYLIADRRGQRVQYNALHTRFKKALGTGDWQLRDLRAKAASDSPDLKHAQELLGHESEVTTAGIYRRSRGNVVAPLQRKI